MLVMHINPLSRVRPFKLYSKVVNPLQHIFLIVVNKLSKSGSVGLIIPKALICYLHQLIRGKQTRLIKN